MQEITYEDAAILLAVSKPTLYNAVSRGVLTALPRRGKKPGRLALEQVELFKRRQLTLSELSTEEAIKWHEVDRAVSAMHKKTVPALDTTTRSITILTDVVDRVTDLAIDAFIELKTLDATSVTPDMIVSVLINSQAFSKIAKLVGLDMQAIPDETMQAIQGILFNALSKAALRIAMLQLEDLKQANQETPLPVSDTNQPVPA